MNAITSTSAIAVCSLVAACSHTGGTASAKPAAGPAAKRAQAEALSHRAEEAYAAKDIDQMIHLYQEAINVCLTDLSAATPTELEDAEVKELLHTAKAAAYNLGANTWPGWDQEGITLSAHHLEAGRKAAQQNLELAQRLRRGPDKLSIAHWLIGAHAIAYAALEEATARFELSRQLGEQSGSADLVNLARGYIFLTKVLQGDATAQRGLDETIRHFDALAATNESASSYANQLRSAFAVFSGQRTP